MNPRAVLTWMLVCAPAVVSAQDLSRYRDIAFGSSVAIVAAATGSNARGMSILHARPALVEELLWRPQYAIGRPAGSVEAAKEITFRFVDDQLYRVVVLYDARLVEGLSTQDLISAVSEVYGPALPAAALKQAVTPQTVFGGSTVLGRWVSPKHEFTLVRDVLPGTFRLIGASKQLDALASAAVIEATRLDRIDAPRREAERLAEESKARIAAAEKTRATNKDEFRP